MFDNKKNESAENAQTTTTQQEQPKAETAQEQPKKECKHPKLVKTAKIVGLVGIGIGIGVAGTITVQAGRAKKLPWQKK